MAIQEERFGTTPSGEAVERYTLVGTNVVAQVISYGAILTSLKSPDRSGVATEISLGFDDLEGYLGEHPYFGATVGRYANRIRGGKFTLSGVEYKLAQNLGTTHLHGGVRGFDKVIWNATLRESESEDSVEFTYVSPDREEGYPGELTTKVTYTLSDRDELRIDYEATTTKPTHLNLTNHAYWNLSGAGSGNVYRHALKMNATSYLPLDQELVPTGEVSTVESTPLDFTTPTPIGERIDQVDVGYDFCYILDSDVPDSDVSDRGGERKLASAAVIYEPASGRTMEVLTTQPAIQLYTGNYLDGIRGAGGAVFQKHHAFCLETQHYPDSPNQPHFPSTVLEPGQTFQETTVHRFSVA